MENAGQWKEGRRRVVGREGREMKSLKLADKFPREDEETGNISGW